MLSPSVLDALNNQVQLEFSSAYAYLGMAAHFERVALPGCAHWMRSQAREETGHAMKLFQFILDRDGKVELKAIGSAATEFSKPLSVFEAGLEHERRVTRSIHALYALAQQERDSATESHLKWFIDEQVEEEKNASELVELFRRAGDDQSAVLHLDQRLSNRGGGDG